MKYDFSWLIRHRSRTGVARDQRLSPTTPPEKDTFEVPTWFVENCVLRAHELKHRSIPLILKSSTTLQDDSTTVKEPQSHNGEPGTFEVDTAVYEALYMVLSQSPKSELPRTTLHGSPTIFKKDKLCLTVPVRRSGEGGAAFLQSIVEYFAREIEADLITLSAEDIEYLFRQHPASYDDTYVTLRKLRNPPTKRESKDEQLSEELLLETKQVSVFSALLESRHHRKDDYGIRLSQKSTTPLIVHLSDSHQFAYTMYGASSQQLTKALDKALFGHSSSKGNVLLITSSHISDSYQMQESTVLLIPTKSIAQLELLESGPSGKGVEIRNIKEIQKKAREFSKGRSPPLFEPYANWDFLAGSKAAEQLSSQPLSTWEITYIAGLIAGDENPRHIERTIVKARHRARLFSDWNVEETDNKWSGFPPKIQDVIRGIEQDRSGYLAWEKELLALLVIPGSVEKGWSDIELDDEVISTIKQVIEQPINTGRSTQGILKRGRIGGALLYGPPGTGKTHLARVVSRECQTTMISVSAADIENKYVGETEKVVKALFNLGRLVSPSVIFIDEADGLLNARNPHEQSWERRRVNQLLLEMDGLAKMKNAPFVLLATNFPHQIDHAVFRRTPCRLYIGLPSTTARGRIFKICLRDDEVDETLDFGHIASITKGYTGSDIHNMCVQAALILEAETVQRGRDDAEPLKLKKEHLEKAFRRSAPTVSPNALAEIREFAKTYDPAGWQKMAAGDGTREVRSEASTMNPGHGRKPIGSEAGKIPKQYNVTSKEQEIGPDDAVPRAPLELGRPKLVVLRQ